MFGLWHQIVSNGAMATTIQPRSAGSGDSKVGYQTFQIFFKSFIGLGHCVTVSDFLKKLQNSLYTKHLIYCGIEIGVPC
jgi:hypothetical protein